ncbi:MAG: NAD(P)/FAD-dependent oxidoreductase [Candidatus Heimdallarchaeaceae archaeon]
MSLEKCDLAIIGSGLTGMSAALAAYSRNPQQIIKIFGIPFDSNTAKKGEIENIPGINKVVGVDYIQQIITQIENLSVEFTKEDEPNKLEFINEDVTTLAKNDAHFQLITDSRNIEAKAVIISTGLPELKHTIKGEDEFVHKGVSHCAVCDGALFRGRKVAIIGEGNFVARGALFLRKYCRKVTVICQNSTLDSDDRFLKKLSKSEKISLKFNIDLESVEIFGSQNVEGLRFQEDGENRELTINAVFVELKDKPDLTFLKDITLDITENGYIIKNAKNTTSVEGIFTAGSISGEMDYIPILMGDGYKAGISATEYLKK